MKTKEVRFTIMKEIEDLVREWFCYVEGVGNECAYTDSIIELIQKKGKRALRGTK